ncbi:NADP-dependent oxidoreductase [Streptacidiphilus anmyonensis]|uniref:NADP-dependent oxidoreductase n=1 Tax=Streptacidiphilus anmyonensis TaxID=405782 RepID=UPI000A43EF66|nr:NADP-dependent oxidoreductase [Streptacidiphilus anmyonensis]
MSAIMRAVRGHRRGGPEQLRYEVAPKPDPGSGEVLVAVRAASITAGELGWDATWTDRFDGTGTPRVPIVPSKEVSGVVAELGQEAEGFAVGDAVYGLIPFLRDGAAAEYTTIPAEVLAAKPPSLNHQQAAALPLAGLTAWQGLVGHGGLTRGQRVLVHGGAGGVGSFVVQVAAALGATVAATAAGADEEFVRGLGASQVIDFTTRRFEDEVKDVDLVFDTVGGDSQSRSWQVLRPGGALVSIVAPPVVPERSAARAVFFVVEPDRAGLEELTALVESGRLTPRIDRTVPLAEAPLAYAALEREHRRGKIVLQVS